MKIVKGSLAFAVIVLLAGAAQAATVTYSLYQDKQSPSGPVVPGSFVVTAKVTTGDNGGLSGFGMDLLGGILTMDHKSPRDPSADTATQSGPTGFTLGRSADNVPFIVGSQDIANPDAIMVYGMGQTANSFANLGITVGGSTLEQGAWDAELILATGTYAGLKPTFNPVSPNGGANVFVQAAGVAVRAPETTNLVVIPAIPEPATFAGFAMIGVVAALRRRLIA
jgi:hypothetical protein